jgi:SAM-dependent methyltransferase
MRQTSMSGDLKSFYENDYRRGTNIAPIPANDDFMYGQVLRELRPHLRKGARVLDLGSNNGTLSFYMARWGCNVTGIDLAQNAVDCASAGATHHEIKGAEFRCMDFLESWDEPDTFDFVLCSHVIEHVPDDVALMKKVAWSMKSGGTLLVLSPCPRASLYRAHKFLRGSFPHDDQVGHLRRYSLGDLSRLCGSAGLAATRQVHLDGPMRDWVILFRPLNKLHRFVNRRHIRTVFNRMDYYLAQFIFPGAVCVHAVKPTAGTGGGS